MSGVLHGLFRVRYFTQDDAHIYCTPEQLEDEVLGVVRFMHQIYAAFGFTDVKIELSTRPEKSIGSDEMWERAEGVLARVLEREGIAFQLNPGDGAFYGPKLDFQVTDAIGRAWQLGTLQVDFSNPERFDLTYTAEDGSKQRPVVLHRAILGSLERFFGILIEHTGGDFPFWLAPEQVRLVPVSEKFNDYAEEVLGRVREAGLRATADARNEKLGAKIRNGEMEKVPALLIVGEKELAAGTVSLRVRHGGEFKDRNVEDLLRIMKSAVAGRSLAWHAAANPPASPSRKSS